MVITLFVGLLLQAQWKHCRSHKNTQYNYLVASSANINARDGQGRNLLQFAVKIPGNEAAVSVSLENGVNVNTLEYLYDTVLL